MILEEAEEAEEEKEKKKEKKSTVMMEDARQLCFLEVHLSGSGVV